MPRMAQIRVAGKKEEKKAKRWSGRKESEGKVAPAATGASESRPANRPPADAVGQRIRKATKNLTTKRMAWGEETRIIAGQPML
jgi:hypothetical protein